MAYGHYKGCQATLQHFLFPILKTVIFCKWTLTYRRGLYLLCQLERMFCRTPVLFRASRLVGRVVEEDNAVLVASEGGLEHLFDLTKVFRRDKLVLRLNFA